MTSITLNESKDITKNILSSIWDYIDMRYPHQNIIHSTTDDMVFVFHGHQLKVIEWLVCMKIKFRIDDYESLDNDLTQY